MHIMDMTERSTADQREEWFSWWLHNGRNDLATSEHFGVTRSTINRWRAKEDCPGRAIKLDLKLRDIADKKITADRFTNIKIVRLLKEKMLEKLIGKDDGGIEKLLVQPTIRDLLQACQYEDELMGNMPKNEDTHIVQLFTGVNGSEDAATFNDRNLGAIFGSGNGHDGDGRGTEVTVPSTSSRLP